jgi:hypothetical protein
MVAFWEVSGGYGGAAAEEGILSLLSPCTSQASLRSLFLSVFYFYFLITLCLSLPSSRGKKSRRFVVQLSGHVFNF